MNERATISNKLDITTIRKEFPILQRNINGRPLVYFDNAATSQKPSVVIDTIKNYYEQYNSNIHRGVHYLSNQATNAYEEARSKVQHFINAAKSEEVNFTKGTTESINLVAHSYGRKYINEGDEIIISTMEHHSNIVPWQILCEERKAKLKVIPINDEGEMILEELDKLLTEKTKLVAIVHVSNALGVINPVKDIIQKAHALNIPVLLDGAQAVPHSKVDVQDLDCDFYCFSGHKMFGPTGTGILYGKEKWLEEMLPYQSGGEMIKNVTFENTTYNDLPYKFEAGTPNIAGGIALGAAIEYINKIGIEQISHYEMELLDYGTEMLSSIPGFKMYGTACHKTSVFSFLLGDIHPYDIGTILNEMGIAIRTGHHCCQPLMSRYNIEGTCRASLAFYNTKEELDKLLEGLVKAKNMLS